MEIVGEGDCALITQDGYWALTSAGDDLTYGSETLEWTMSSTGFTGGDFDATSTVTFTAETVTVNLAEDINTYQIYLEGGVLGTDGTYTGGTAMTITSTDGKNLGTIINMEAGSSLELKTAISGNVINMADATTLTLYCGSTSALSNTAIRIGDDVDTVATINHTNSTSGDGYTFGSDISFSGAGTLHFVHNYASYEWSRLYFSASCSDFSGTMIVEGYNRVGFFQFNDLSTFNASDLQAVDQQILFNACDADLSATNLRLTDSTIVSGAGNLCTAAKAIISFGTLTVSGSESLINTDNGSEYTFSDLTNGEGETDITFNYSGTSGQLAFEQITDFDGTLQNNSEPDTGKIYIGNVTVSSGVTTNILGNVYAYSDKLAVKGTGALNLGTLALLKSEDSDYSFDMSQSNMSIDTLVFSQDLTLCYDYSDTSVLATIGEFSGAEDSSLLVDMTGIDLDLLEDDGFNLGISSSYMGSIEVSGLDEGTYALKMSSGMWRVIAVEEGSIITFSGESLNWADGTIFDNDLAFNSEKNQMVTLNATSTIMVTGDIAADTTSITADANVTLGSSDPSQYQLSTNVIIQGDGILTLSNDVLDDDTIIDASSALSTIIIDAGSGNSLEYYEMLKDYTGTLMIASGSLVYEGSSVTELDLAAAVITVASGASLDLTNNINSNTIAFEDGATLNSNSSTLQGNYDFQGNTTLDVDGGTTNFTAESTISGGGTLTKTGNDDIELNGTVSHTGSFVVAKGGLVDLYNPDAVAFSDIVMNGGNLRIMAQPTNELGFTLTLGGALLQDSSTLVDVSINKVIASDGTSSAVKFENSGSAFTFGELSGGGNIMVYSEGTDFDFTLTIDLLNDFSGTISNNADDISTLWAGATSKAKSFGELHISEVYISEGKTTTISGTSYTDSLVKSGAGSLSIDSLILSDDGFISMKGEGDVTISSLELEGSATFFYDELISDSKLVQIDSLTLADGSLIELSFSGVMDSAILQDYDLGIDGDIDISSLSASQWGELDKDYTLDNTSGTWHISLSDSIEFDSSWDVNWGADGLSGFPISAPAADAASSSITTTKINDVDVNMLSLAGDSTYELNNAVYGDYTAINYTGTTSTSLNYLVGGNTDNSEFIGSSWIEYSDGDMSLVIGGNSGVGGTFTGDSHIMINDGTVDYVVGGNSGTGDSIFTGDSYVSVYTNVIGRIIGGSAAYQDSTVTFTGDTNVFIYVPQISIEGVAPSSFMNAVSESSNITSTAIVGGMYRYSDQTTTQTVSLIGDTNVLIDLSDYVTDEDVAFTRAIIGGSTNNTYGNFIYQLGDTNVTVISTDKVNFTGLIIGGSYANSTTAINQVGDTHVTVVAGSDTSITGNIVGGNSGAGYTSSIIDGDVYLDISGDAGSNISMMIVGGNSHSGNNSTFESIITGSINISISGDLSITPSMEFGSFVGADCQTVSSGDINVDITGGTFTWKIFAGHCVNKTVDNVICGDITLNLSGATFESNCELFGGNSINGSGAVGKNVVSGDIVINMSDLTFEGNLYGAGKVIAGASSLTAGDVTISVASDVTYGTGILSGGYGDYGATGTLIKGTSTLLLSEGNDDVLATAQVIDFDVVDVAAGASINLSSVLTELSGTSSSTTKTGAGSLVLAAGSTGGSAIIAEGTLVLGVASESSDKFTAVTVQAGGTLDASNQISANLGALSLAEGSGLLLALDEFDGVSFSSLTVDGAFDLSLSDDLEGKYKITLFSDVTFDSIDGIDFITSESGYISANASDYISSINGESVESNVGLYYDELTSSIVLANSGYGALDLVWADGVDGVWLTDSEVTSGWVDISVDVGFGEGDNVTFDNTASDTSVSVESAGVIANDMYVTGATYSFEGGDITLEGELSLSQAEASFTNSIDLSVSKVTLDAKSKLIFAEKATIDILSNEGSIVSTAALTLSNATETGGSITATSLSLTGEVNIFTSLNVESITGAQSLTLTAGGNIGSINEGADLIITAGTTTLGSSSLASLDNSGILKVEGELILKSATDAGGNVSAESITLTGENIFTSLTATGTVTSTGSLSVDDASFAAFSGSGVLAVSGTAAITGSGSATLSDLSGEGSLHVGGSLTLSSSSATSIGNLSVAGSTLTLASDLITGSLSIAADTGSASQLVIDYSLANAALTATDFTVDSTGLNVIIEGDALRDVIWDSNDSYSLTNVNNGIGNLDADKLLLNGEESSTAVLNSTSLSSTSYILELVDGNLVFTRQITGLIWEGTTSEGTWNNSSFGTEGADESATVVFNGAGTETVNVEGSVESAQIFVLGGTYSFSGSEDDSLTTDYLKIEKSSQLTVDIQMNVGGEGIDLSDGSSLNVTDTAVLVTDCLIVSDSSSLSNTGELSVGANSVLGQVEGAGKLTITGDSSIDAMDEQASLNIAAGATLTFNNSASLAKLNNEGEINMGDNSLTLTGQAQGGSIMAKELIIDTTATAVNTSAITSDLIKLSKLERFTDSLSISEDEGAILATAALESYSDGAITLDLSDIVQGAFDDMENELEGLSYLLITNTGAEPFDVDLVWDDETDALVESYESSNNRTVSISTSDTGDVLLAISDIFTYVWNTSTDDVVNNNEGGAVVYSDLWAVQSSGVMNDYTILDEVVEVQVTADTTISLMDAAIAAAGDNITLAGDEGVTIANLTGNEGKTLTLLGDGSEDIFNLINTAESSANSALVASNVTLNVDTKGDNGKLNLASLTMADTDLNVAEAATLNVTELNATNTDINIDGDMSVVTMTADKDSTIAGTLNMKGGTSTIEASYDTATLNYSSGSSSTLSLVKTSSESLSINAAASTLNFVTDGACSVNSLNADASTLNFSGFMGGSDSITLAEASTITASTINVNVDSEQFDNDAFVLFDGELSLGAGTTNIILTDIGNGAFADIEDATFTIASTLNRDSDAEIELSIIGGKMGSYFTATDSDGDGTYELSTNTNAYNSMAQTENGAAGLAIASDAVFGAGGDMTHDGDRKAAFDSLNEYKAADNYADADKLGAAMAGASTSSLGSALMTDVGRQLNSIRNRSRSMGVNPAVVNEGMPYYNAWVSAEGGSSQLDADGTMAGHDLNSTGGSVGVEADINDRLSLGFAYSYLLGDLSADGADTAEGDLDSMYGSVYARINNRRWTHSIVATYGTVDASLDRTVAMSGDSYKTKGDTDGQAFGLMYEVGYTYALNDNATTCIQPIFNLSYVNSCIDGYTETGSNAGLTVGDQENSYVTFGLGAVLETVIGEDMYNRSSILSTRFMLKADAGDRQSEADVTMSEIGGITERIKGAEVGSVGMEFGLGLTIPVTENVGAIFIDGSCEMRSGMTEFNGTVGYRFSF